MRIQPIVEGDGEVQAVPVLLRRLRDEIQAYGLDIGKPIRKKRAQLVRETSLREAVRLALLQPECRAVLVLLDGDDDCPKELAPRLDRWARSEAGATPCSVVIAHREYEAWFLAALESLRGKRGIRASAASASDPEAPRGAKERLEDFMEPDRSYLETLDQAPLSAVFDMSSAYRRSRSFRKMAKAFGELASGAGIALGEWPPSGWSKG